MGILATGEGVDKRPNILFIIADDQSLFDFKFYNPRSTLDAPVLEKLASEGMVIDGAYQMGSWVGGVCTASRHMTMSGRTLWHVPDKAGRIMTPHVNNPRMVPPDLVKHTAHFHLKCNVADFSSGSDKREFGSSSLRDREYMWPFLISVTRSHDRVANISNIAELHSEAETSHQLVLRGHQCILSRGEISLASEFSPTRTGFQLKSITLHWIVWHASSNGSL